MYLLKTYFKWSYMKLEKLKKYKMLALTGYLLKVNGIIWLYFSLE